LQAENLRKMFLPWQRTSGYSHKAGRPLHNMRTLKYMPPEKQIEKAKKLLKYTPLWLTGLVYRK